MEQLEQFTDLPIEPIYWQGASSESINFGFVQVPVPNRGGEEMTPVAALARQRLLASVH